jgi:CelD/BcsL family acetyltransferase involved in cellulose biosynthesis
MFDYLVNEYNPSSRLSIAPAPPAPGRVQRRLPYSTSVVVDLPETAAGLRARQSKHFWSELARRERRFAEAHGPLSFSLVSDPEVLRRRLPEVRALYAQRWADEYTSLQWKTEGGFAPYAEALLDLAAQDRGALALLDGDGRLLAFGYCLLEAPWCYLYQHAASPDPRYRPFGPGKVLVARLLTALVERGDTRHVDLMLGDAEYKREWESWRRPVELVLEAPATPLGRAELAAATAYHRARHRLQFGSPRARALLKRGLRLAVQR